MSLRLGLALSFGLAVILEAGACETTVCRAECATAGAIIDQSNLTSPIVTLTAEAPCSVTLAPPDGDGGREVYVSTPEGAPTSGSCQINAFLADGTSWVAIFSWAPNASACCPNSTKVIGGPPIFTQGND